MKWLDGITDSMDMNLSKLQQMWQTGKPGMLQSMGSLRVGTTERHHFHFSLSCIGEDLNTGEDWGQEENGVTEDEMVGWHHRLSGHELEKTLGDS